VDSFGKSTLLWNTELRLELWTVITGI